jgi:hypothetical protein
VIIKFNTKVIQIVQYINTISVISKEFVKLLCILCIFLCDLHDVKRCSYGPYKVSGSQGTNDGIQEHHVLLPGLEFDRFKDLK